MRAAPVDAPAGRRNAAMTISKLFLAGRASIAAAIPLAFLSTTTIPVSGNFLDILANPVFWLSYAIGVEWYFLVAFLASCLTLLWPMETMDNNWTGAAAMRRILRAGIASAVVAIPLAFLSITISTLVAFWNVRAVMETPGLWFYYIKAVSGFFGGGFLASCLSLFLVYRKRNVWKEKT
jgi:ABC-type glycerol-3-phosphate transport system permease component